MMMNFEFGYCEVLLAKSWFIFKPMAKSTLTYLNPDEQPTFIHASETDDHVGREIIETLSRGRWVDDITLRDVLSGNRVEAAFETLVQQALKLTGCKTKASLFKNMKCVAVSVKGDLIEFLPMVQKGSQPHFIASEKTPREILIDKNSSFEVLSRALKGALDAL